MRRFWVLPLLFTILLGAFAMVLEQISWFASLVLLPLMLSKTDVYIHAWRFDLKDYLPFMAFGCVTGLIFAALDFALHFPDDPRGSNALQKLLSFRRLFLVTVGVVLLNNFCLQLGVGYWQSHRRYHVYDPQSEIFNLISLVLPSVFLLLLLWMMKKTLQRPRVSAN